MTYNFHTHTYHCGHATGTPKEYVQRAIACGVTRMGFSDHFPYLCSDGFESSHRVPVAQAKDYVNEICDLREKYRGKIELFVGFEMEYYPDHFEKMLNSAIAYGAQYLIMGEHFIDEEHPNGCHVMTAADSLDFLRRYVKCVCQGIRTKKFTYIAHPDMVLYAGDASVFQTEMRPICEAALECDVPLELNLLGVRDHRNYPNPAFWQIAGEVGCPVTFGFDAHDVQSAYDSASLEKAREMVKTYALNYIGCPVLRALTTKEGA